MKSKNDTTAAIADDVLLTAKHAAKVLDLSGRRITELARAGQLPHTRDSIGRRLYRVSELRRFQEQRQARRASNAVA